MEKVFAQDQGLGVLAQYNGRPDMSQQDKDLQGE